MVKYTDDADKPRIREYFESIPKQLAKENKKSQYSIVKKGGRASQYIGSIQWLEGECIILEVKAKTSKAAAAETPDSVCIRDSLGIHKYPLVRKKPVLMQQKNTIEVLKIVKEVDSTPVRSYIYFGKNQ